jgi:hypothetical protein
MKSVKRPSPKGRKAEKALKQAVADVIEEHRRLGLPIAVMHRGKAVFLPVEQAAPLVRETKSSYRKRK